MSKMETLFATRFETPIGPLRIVSSDKGLAFVELPHASGRGFALPSFACSSDQYSMSKRSFASSGS